MGHRWMTDGATSGFGALSYPFLLVDSKWSPEVVVTDGCGVVVVDAERRFCVAVVIR